MTTKRVATVARMLYGERVPEMEGEPDHSPRYEVEVRGIYQRDTDELVRVESLVRAGIGVSPHWAWSSKRLRAFGWALIHAADRIDEARTPPVVPQLEQLPFPKARRR